MRKCVDMTVAMGQKYSVQTFDQQLYSIAKQVAWTMPETFRNHIIRLGGFHTLSCFIAAIGKLWGDGGLKDLLVDSSVYASGTVDQMLNGKEFNRAVRALTLAFEALYVSLLSAFFKWCVEKDVIKSFPISFWSSLSYIASNFNSNQEVLSSIHSAMADIERHMLPLLKDFRQWGCNVSPTFKFWDKFLTTVEIMLQNIRSEREGLWSLHLSSVSAMVPFIFVTNRVNYSRWLPVYIQDMFNLPPDVLPAFESGDFSIRQKPSAFNGIWSDMATEKTVIKDSKGCGGIVNITRQKPALIRWSLTRHILADFSSEMRKRSGFTAVAEQLSHEEAKPTSMRRDDDHLKLLVDHMQQRMTDPFDVSLHPKPLINISTGMHAPRDIESSLINAVQDGAKMAKSFIDGALADDQHGNFYGPITRSKLKKFEDLTKKTKLKCRSSEIIEGHINPELVFRRALVLANSRDDVTVEKVLSFPIGPIPTSLFHDDGTMRKTCKADLGLQLEALVSSVKSLEHSDKFSTVLIRDVRNIDEDEDDDV
ncbi:unnamed protein product [Mytilus coruscus]|uniref:Uncharacterized protein n=1 Tax=Mytilus coruscus TaxID=42192 RepID=A0A6J7ZYR3_MYTCO|nr:unnamed protein product [Mytilus coruscus]